MESLAAAAAALGVPAGSLIFLCSMLLSPLLSAAHSHVRGTAARHLASLLLGLAMCCWNYGYQQLRFLLVPVTVAYALTRLTRRHAGPVVLVASFAFLVYCHLRAASGDAWKEGRIDYTGTLMVLTLKLVSTAFDYADGAREEGALTAHQRASRMATMPSFLAYLGYIFYPGTLLAGPWLSCADFLAFIAHTGAWASTSQPLPRARLHVLRCCVLGVVFLGLHSTFAPKLPDRAFLSSGWVSHSLGFKLLYMWAMAFAARCKYYFVWLWAEAACVASGLAWSGTDWSRCRNIQPAGVELATSAAVLASVWNTRTGLWLRHYVYERVAPPSRGPAPFWALLLTQTVSGVWHGVYAGYALFFLTSTLMFHASKVLFRYQRNLAGNVRRISDFAHGLLTAFHLSYSAAVFIAVTLPASRAAWASVHYLGHVSMVGICLLGALVPAGKRREGGAREDAPVPASGGRRKLT